METKVETKFQIRDFLKEVLISNSLVDIIINLAYHPEMIDKSRKISCILHFKNDLVLRCKFFVDDYKSEKSKNIKISYVCFLHKVKGCECESGKNSTWSILDKNTDYRYFKRMNDENQQRMLQYLVSIRNV